MSEKPIKVQLPATEQAEAPSDATCPRCGKPATNIFHHMQEGEALGTAHCGCLYQATTQPTASNAGEREATELLRELVLAQNDYNDAIGAWGSGRPAAKEELRLLKARGAAHVFITTRAALASKPTQGEKKPVGYMSEKQIPAIKDQDGEGGNYIPMRKTPAGLFQLALYTASNPEPVGSKQRADAFVLLETHLRATVEHGQGRADLLKALGDLYLAPPPEPVAPPAREALKRIYYFQQDLGNPPLVSVAEQMREIARAALARGNGVEPS